MATKRLSDKTSLNNSFKMGMGAASAAIPDTPTIGTATKINDVSATVSYTAATLGAAGTTFTATSTPGSITGSSATSPITVSGLTPLTNYTFTVKASNGNGNSPNSAASNQITTDAEIFYFTTDYLVIAGGGGGGYNAGGGGGGYRVGAANGGTGGGGAGSLGGGTVAAVSGSTNTGSGGGAGNNATGTIYGEGANGGSGVVILRYPDSRTISFGAGLTGTESAASGGYKRATVTAGTGNVSWT